MLQRRKVILAGDDEPLKKIYLGYTTMVESLPPICFITEPLLEKVIPRLYATADAFVLPTRAEGWGLPIILGMAMGLPCITTNWGGVTEFATPETTLLVDVLSPEGEDVSADPEFFEMEPGMRVGTPLSSHLRGLMLQLFNDRPAAALLGQRARAHIVANFSSARLATLTRLRLIAIARKLQVGEGSI
jgi:glycosyltransferase involved in cell wall biosynthesis